MAKAPDDHPQHKPVNPPPVAERHPPDTTRETRPPEQTPRQKEHESKEAEKEAGYRPDPEDDPLRPPAPGSRDYVAGQPVDPHEAEVTERERQAKIRPEIKDLPEGVSANPVTGTEENPLHGALPYERSSTEPGTRADGRALSSSPKNDDDVNKDPREGSEGTRPRGPDDRPSRR